MKSSAQVRYSKLVLGLFVVCLKAVQGCATTTPGASGPGETHDLGPAASVEIIPVRGTLFVSGGELRGHLENFRSPLPVAGAAAEIYVTAFPTEEFDADVIETVPLDEGWYGADLRIVTDTRLSPGTAFEGRLVVRPAEKIACEGVAAR